jgi:hypothetical protein
MMSPPSSAANDPYAAAASAREKPNIRKGKPGLNPDIPRIHSKTPREQATSRLLANMASLDQGKGKIKARDNTTCWLL